jgi:hypothetical protein
LLGGCAVVTVSRNPTVPIWSIPTPRRGFRGHRRQEVVIPPSSSGQSPRCRAWTETTALVLVAIPPSSSGQFPQRIFGIVVDHLDRRSRNPTVLIWSIPTSPGLHHHKEFSQSRNPTVLIWSIPTAALVSRGFSVICTPFRRYPLLSGWLRPARQSSGLGFS